MVIALGEPHWLDLSARAKVLDGAALRALSPLLIIVPHPDDETLGCGGLLATAIDLGLQLRVAYLTDGAGSHVGSPTWSPRRLAVTRRREALKALSVLGVCEEDVRFLQWPDGAPRSQNDPRYSDTVDCLVEWSASLRPKSIWATWAGEPHGDHKAAASLADDLATRLSWKTRRLDYLVWGWGLAEVGAGRLVHSLACPATIARRRAALACHLTQTTNLIADTPDAFLIPANLAALTLRPCEIYLESP